MANFETSLAKPKTKFYIAGHTENDKVILTYSNRIDYCSLEVEQEYWDDPFSLASPGFSSTKYTFTIESHVIGKVLANSYSDAFKKLLIGLLKENN